MLLKYLIFLKSPWDKSFMYTVKMSFLTGWENVEPILYQNLIYFDAFELFEKIINSWKLFSILQKSYRILESIEKKRTLIWNGLNCVKSVRIRSFSSLYFPTFGLNIGKYGPEKLRMRTLFTQASFKYFGYF